MWPGRRNFITTAAAVLLWLNLIQSQPSPLSTDTVATTNFLIQVLYMVETSTDCPLVFSDCNSGSTESDSFNFEQVTQTLAVPSILLQTSASSRRLPRNTRFSCTHFKFLICTVDLDYDSLRKVAHHTRTIGEPKYDVHLFLDRSSDFERLFQLPSVQKLKYKLGVDLTTELVYREPEPWSGSITPRISYTVPPFDHQSINLYGHHLKVSANTLKPFILTEEEKTNSTESVKGGTHYMILQYGAAYYNFSLEFDIDPDRGSGKPIGNGSYNGMMGDVLQSDFDIVFVARLVEGQIGIIDLTTFTSVDTLIFLIAHPKRALEWEAMMYSFKPSTWFLILVTFLCISFAYMFCLKIEAIISGRRNKYHISDAFTIPFATGLAQMAKIPKKTYFLTAVWLVYVLNINIAYNSNLISYLNLPSNEEIPRTFEELASRPDYNITFNYLSSGQCYCFTFFNTSESPVYRDISNRFAPNLEPDTGSCVLTAALKPKNVCVGWRSVTNVGLARNATIYHETFVPLVDSAPAYVSYNSIGLDKNSKYTDSFSRYITMLRDTGIINQLYKEAIAHESSIGRAWFNSRDKQETSETEITWNFLKARMEERLVTTAAFKMENFEFHFSVLATGFVLGCIVIVTELLYSNTKIIMRRTN